ncbi:hypothetical protein [Aquimarina litoralis]|uniref:hypothetical protein n=1 Tax=Aquimarina litoralis TaxID=584605 RepID=UPI001C57EC37|nr:hypothetical protein [Aquimarina litoralis]MBW1294161.1 hypothetical protein [Aquimarina litoralis]
MKIKLQILFTIIALCICLNACKDSSETSEKNASNTELTKEQTKNDSLTNEQPEKKEDKLTLLSSKLRPNEHLELGKSYTDTISFISFDDNYDYWHFLAKKNKDTIDISYNIDGISQLATGDTLEINWELKIMEEAGDPKITYTKPFLISFKKINAEQSSNQKIKVLWRETLYDEELETDINTIALNNEYLEKITAQERAALGYITTFIGNECEWDGKANKDRSNLSCVVLSKLKLGYQCSEKHLGFLRTWFSKDTLALKKLQSCPTIPNTATIQTTFDEIYITTDITEQIIKIDYQFTGINTRRGSVKENTYTDTFSYNDQNITLISSKKTNNSFVISCGSGCAMTYSEHQIVSNPDSGKVTFKVEMFVNEQLSDEYYEAYIYTCDETIDKTMIKLEGTKNFSIEILHEDMQEKLKSYASRFCKK